MSGKSPEYLAPGRNGLIISSDSPIGLDFSRLMTMLAGHAT